MSKLTKDQYRALAKMAGVHIEYFEGNTPLIASEGCFGGIYWDPAYDLGDAIALAFKLNLKFQTLKGGAVHVWHEYGNFTVTTEEGCDKVETLCGAIIEAALKVDSMKC